MIYKKLPPVDPLAVGCLNCPPVEHEARSDMLIAVGFGAAYATKNGDVEYNGEDEFQHGRQPKTVRDIEEMAQNNPDCDWQIVKIGPLRSVTYQRQGHLKWVCVKAGKGFA